jgi:hypothetical protein
MDDEIRTGIIIVKMCTSLLLIIIMTPIIVCDIYFGFTDNSCVNEIPNGMYFTMNFYLLGSGFSGLACLLILIYTNYSLTTYNNEITLVYLKCIGLIVFIFNLIWNIIGAVTFWGYVYKRGHCDSKTSSYIYASLIIKFVGTLITLQQNSNKKK